jgi:bifunctional non-homologous end joining protein LigD
MQSSIDRITLYYREGTSDKVYEAAIVPAGGDGLFTVEFAFGRRGATLQTGIKTPVPVLYEKARAVFDRLVAAKTAKGYTSGVAGIPYAGIATERHDTGVRCQLLNPIDEATLGCCLDSPRWLMQEKFDGRRLLVRRHGGEATGINRRGLQVALPGMIAESANALPGSFIIDGEAVGDTLHAFDLLEEDGRDLRPRAYRYRFGRLTLLLAIHRSKHIRAVDTMATADGKRTLFERLRNGGAEGVVFKDPDAPHTPGRPNSGGSQRKFKFHESASCIVAGRNERRSVALAMLEHGRLVGCGNVAVPPDRDIPAEGAVVEVRYLYAFPESNALFQPVYLGTRGDLDPGDCTLDQLKHKAA